MTDAQFRVQPTANGLAISAARRNSAAARARIHLLLRQDAARLRGRVMLAVHLMYTNLMPILLVVAGCLVVILRVLKRLEDRDD